MTALTAASAPVEPVVSQHQLDVFVLALFLGLAAVFALVMVCALAQQLATARRRATVRVRGGRR